MTDQDHHDPSGDLVAAAGLAAFAATLTGIAVTRRVWYDRYRWGVGMTGAVRVYAGIWLTLGTATTAYLCVSLAQPDSGGGGWGGALVGGLVGAVGAAVVTFAAVLAWGAWHLGWKAWYRSTHTVADHRLWRHVTLPEARANEWVHRRQLEAAVPGLVLGAALAAWDDSPADAAIAGAFGAVTYHAAYQPWRFWHDAVTRLALGLPVAVEAVGPPPPIGIGAFNLWACLAVVAVCAVTGAAT